MPFALHTPTRVAAAAALAALATSAGAQFTTQQFVGFADVEPMPMARSDMTVTTLPSTDPEGTRMYLIGGCSSDQVCDSSSGQCYCSAVTNRTMYYLPAQNRYVTTCADAPRERFRHASATVNGTIYLFGGRDVSDNVITAVDAYDVRTNTWSTPCQWPSAASDNTAFVDGTRVFLVGGYVADYSSAVGALVEFSAATCTFTPRAAMPAPRGDAASVSAGGLHFVIGGFSSNFCAADADVNAYNATSNTWLTLSGLRLGRGDAAVGQIGGRVFAIAGETVDSGCARSVPVNDVERLDPGASGAYSGSWTVAQSIPSNRFRFVGASYQSSVYLFGGQGDYVANLSGSSGGFPIANTVMQYSPYTYTPAEVTALLDEHRVNTSTLSGLVATLDTTVASQAATIQSMQAQIAQLTSTVGRINGNCLAGTRDRRSVFSPPCGVGGGGSSSSSGTEPWVTGVSVAAAVVVVAAVVAVAVWSRGKKGSAHHKPMDSSVEPVINPVFESSDPK